MHKLQGKNITLISLNFYPEQTAIGLYSTQLAQFLEEQGAHVTVITAYPYYPEWKIHKEYINKESFMEERLGNLRIIRYKQYTPDTPSFLKRVFHIIDFTLGTWRNIKKVTTCDTVISVIPFTSSSWLGNKLSRKHNAKHWIHIQDFEFDAAFQSGLASGKNRRSFLYNRLMKLETSILNKADRVSTISHNMMAKLKTKTTTPPYYLPNWVEAGELHNEPEHPYLNASKFTILYSGNIGEKQDWDFFIEVVARLDLTIYDIVIVGDGSKKQWLEQNLKGNEGVRFYPLVPFSELRSLLVSTDVHILFQKTEILDTVMPSKVLGMMASGKPSIVTGHSEAEVGDVLNSCEGGYYVTENNVETIIQGFEKLRTNPKASKTMGEKARKHVLETYAKKGILEAFCKELDQL